MKTFQKIDGPYKRDPEDPRVIGTDWRNETVEMLADAEVWVATEKIDGTNIRVGWDGYAITFGGRTDRAEIPGPLRKHLESVFLADGIEEWFEEQFPIHDAEQPHDVVLFGEGYGPKIQAGGKYRETVSFIGFDVYVNGVYLAPEDAASVFRSIGVDFVHAWDSEWDEWTHIDNAVPSTLNELIFDVREGLTSAHGDFEPEGLVARTIKPLYDQRGERLIVKIKPENIPNRRSIA